MEYDAYRVRMEAQAELEEELAQSPAERYAKEDRVTSEMAHEAVALALA